MKPAQLIGSDDSKLVTKKVYYLSCSLCRWSSRDTGMPDQTVATGSWQEQQNPYSNRVTELINFYKILASVEKQQKERKKFQAKPIFLQFEKFGITSVMARKRASKSPLTQPPKQTTDQPKPSKASEEIEELPENIFTNSVDITKVTNICQRLMHPELQVENTNELRPQRKQLIVKRSQRCRICEHNVSKPDFCPTSTKFKIQLAAFYHIPEICIVTCEPLCLGKSSELLLKLSNPTQHQTQIILLSLDSPMTPTTSVQGVKEEISRENLQMGCDSPNLLPSAVRQAAVTEELRPVTIISSGDVILPASSLTLPARDDAAEYDDLSDTYNFPDDPKLVIWRKGNQAIIRLHVLPCINENIAKENKLVVIGFVMQYGYVNTIATLEHKAPQKLDMKVKIFLTLGNLVGSV
ncbi:dynactin subunit 4 isoform X2 [Copidosoma floridanum]|nr:dynactin subunit 4 isoform X2 [Copidosoma floridanum]